MAIFSILLRGRGTPFSPDSLASTLLDEGGKGSTREDAVEAGALIVWPCMKAEEATAGMVDLAEEDGSLMLFRRCRTAAKRSALRRASVLLRSKKKRDRNQEQRSK